MQSLAIAQIIKSRSDRLKSVFGSSLIGSWPLTELGGTPVGDVSGYGRNGNYNSISLNNATSPLNKPAPLFGPTAGVAMLNVGSNLVGSFNPLEGAISGFAKLETGGWLDATARQLVTLAVDANNRIQISRGGGGRNNMLTFYYIAGGTVITYIVPMNPSGWFHWLISWSKSNNRMICRINGVMSGSPVAGLGTWVGNLATNQCTIGGYTTAVQIHSGWLSDVVLTNREPTDAESMILASSNVRPIRVSVLGDSISMYDLNVTNWDQSLVGSSWNGGYVGLMNHAVNGANIIASLAGQVTAAANDDADAIIIHMGTNDVDSGDMVALRVVIETAIDNLRTSNPRATIYYMNVLPRWTDTGGGTPIAKGNIRAAIALACANKSVTCWDTFTTPWIVAGDTSDGTHPTSAGHTTKVLPQVVARLP